MAGTRGSRESRFDVTKKFFVQYKNELVDIDSVKQNVVQFLGYFIYESELEKFAEKNPDVNMEEFKKFLDDIEGLKITGKTATGEGGSKTHLNTIEGAQERGVTTENIDAYITNVNSIYALVGELRKLINTDAEFAKTKKAVVSFAIPVSVIPVKEDKKETAATPAA